MKPKSKVLLGKMGYGNVLIEKKAFPIYFSSASLIAFEL